MKAWIVLSIFPACMLADQTSADANGDLQSQVAELRALVRTLQSRVDQLEGSHPVPAPAAPIVTAAVPQTIPPQLPTSTPDLFHGTSFNFLFDGYYGFNFNNPIGRSNRLRSYDVSSNAFSLNQADIVIENAPDVDHGKRYGARVDLQFGQATATLQGNSANEPRPEIYRNIFQAYGTYVLPVGKGLTVDMGKFASSLGVENNYGQDQINYSRSFLFTFLPFYHMGARVGYKFNDTLSANYWIVNGTQQTEPFNGFKDQYFGITVQPHKSLNWTLSYYLGQEHPDVVYYPNGGAPANSPTVQGTQFEPIVSPPSGKLHIIDSYLTWKPSPKLTLALEGDYVVQRLETNSAPSHTIAGAGYLRYQFTPKLAFAARAEYLSDRGGLFSGTTQALKETTATLEYKIAEGFVLRQEWRRDSSNQPYFLTSNLGRLKNEQNTATLGLIWWFGPKQGAW